MAYILLLITISTILSYLILKCIYTIIFKSTKNVSKFLVFLGSIGLIIFYYTPYSFYLEPSYWEFRNMCELNELPNNEEKYNKILRYFDKKLGDIDDFPHTKKYSGGIDYITLVVYYHQYFKEQEENSLEGKIALHKMASETPKEKYRLDSYNIKSMFLSMSWKSNRYYIDGNEGSGFYWNQEILQCTDVKREK